MPNTYEMGGGSATLPVGRNFWNPDPNATSALQAIADRSRLSAMGSVMGTNPELYAPNPVSAPGATTPTTPSTAPGTYSGGVYNWPGQGGSSGGSNSINTGFRGSSANRGSVRSSGGGGAVGGGPVIPEPTYDPVTAPTNPTFTAREYAPPGEDAGFERQKRRELMGAGQRELRQRTQEAIVGARSLSNPAARKDFVRASLAGFGEGLEKVSRGATASAGAAAARKRAEDVSIYNSQYTAKSNADKLNYQNEINTIAQQYSQDQRAAQSKFDMQSRAYLNQPSGNLATAATGMTQSGSNNPTFQYR